MDPRLMKLLGLKVMAPVVEEGGADPDDNVQDEDLENGEEEEEDLEGDEGEDEDEDDDDPEGGDDDEEEEDEEEEEDDDLGDRAKKRIGSLVKRAKGAEAQVAKLQKQLEAAQKLSGDDGKAMLAAAEASGILPGLMSKDEAEAFKNLELIPKVIERYEDWLDDEDADTYGEGDDAMTRSEVKKRVRTLKAKFEALQEQYGDKRKALKAQVRELFELGLKAKKAGWKPEGKKTSKETKKLKTKPTDKTKVPKATKKGKREKDIEVNSPDDLEAYYLSEGK